MIQRITVCLAAFLVIGSASAQVSFTPPGTNPAQQRTETGPATAAPQQPSNAAPQASTPAPGVPAVPPKVVPPGSNSTPAAPTSQPAPQSAQPANSAPQAKVARFAIAPSRLEFTVAGKKQLQPQTINAWSEDKSLVYAAGGWAPWLKVTPLDRKPSDPRQKFTVTVDPTGIPAGKHQGQIEISTPQAEAAPIRIPVTLTVAADAGSEQGGAAAKPSPGPAPPKK
jgi:hypothetical protein